MASDALEGEFWAKEKADSEWKHYALYRGKFYINGTECEPYDIEKLYREAHAVSDLSLRWKRRENVQGQG